MSKVRTVSRLALFFLVMAFASNAVAAASKTLRDLRIAEVSKLDMKVEGGKVVAYRARVQLSFKYDG